MVDARLEELKQKEFNSYYKFSVDGTELTQKLYNISYRKFFEYCVENKIPVHPNRMIIEPQVIQKHNYTQDIDMDDDIDVPSKIDNILEGEVDD